MPGTMCRPSSAPGRTVQPVPALGTTHHITPRRCEHSPRCLQVLPSESQGVGRLQRAVEARSAACSWSCPRSRGSGAPGPPCPGTGSSRRCRWHSCTPPLKHQRQQTVSSRPEAPTVLLSPRQSHMAPPSPPCQLHESQ